MRVTICKTIDVEAEVDVDVDDFLNEFVTEVDWINSDGEQEKFWRRLLGWLDVFTRAIGRIPDGLIAQIPRGARQELFMRLTKEAQRWSCESGIPVAEPQSIKPIRQKVKP